ncbi:hypothetical protein AL468_01200 [Vibrio diabolicus]|uniref:Uncharacterized protein n=1 Tax=Vibrio diabolicus TaxID=50719 RepID=A0ABN5HFK4_9VIBR|nr:hypothetical protein AL468_01200 [Vibrio diabolicus]
MKYKARENSWTVALNILALATFSSLATNALLRGEQRNTEAPAYHLKHKTQRIAKMPSVANHS